jgi:hypothetical protein
MVAASSTPDLVAASDSGTSSTDNITKVVTPTFTGTADAGSTVTLLDGTTVIGTGAAAADGTWTITSSVLASGTHSIAAEASVSGVYTPPSAALSVTIDTLSPAAPSTPDLATASDSGVSSTDNITNVATPTFAGTAEAGSLVQLYDGSTLVGSATTSGTGTWSVVSSKLGDGAHSISATATDVAGNVSAVSGKLAVTTDTVPPSTPLLAGLAASTGSNLTVSGTGDASTTVAILNGTTQLGSITVAAGGSWSLKFSIGNNKTVSTLTAVGSDVSGNKSSASTMQIGTSGGDKITSGAGNELLYGAGGADTFTFSSLFGRDVIADFAATGNAHDIINFHANSVLNSYANVMSHAVQVGSGVVVTQDANNVLTLNNVNRSALTSADFTFV